MKRITKDRIEDLVLEAKLTLEDAGERATEASIRDVLAAWVLNLREAASPGYARAKLK